MTLLNNQAVLGYRLTSVINNTAYFESASGQLSIQSQQWPNNSSARLTLLNNQAAAGWRLSEIVGSVVYFDRPYVPVNQPPSVSPSANPPNGQAPLTVQFTANASDPDGLIVSYAWSFGDGGTSTAADPSYTYTAAGNYQATLTVADNQGATVSGIVSVAVTAIQPPGTVRHVVPSGGSTTSDGVTVPCTIARAIAVAQPGDTIEMAAGIYAGAWGDNGLMDWYGKNGTAAAPIIVQPAIGATVIIKPTATTYRAIYFRNCSWIELHDLTIDGSNLTGEAVKCTTVTNGATDITLLRCEIKSARSMGVLTSGDLTERLTLRQCKIHDGGTDTGLDHAIYLSTPDNVIKDCEIYNWASHQIHVYGNATMHRQTICGNYIHGGGTGIGIYGANNHKVYNNIIAETGGVGIQLRPYEAMAGVLVANNTFTANGNIGILVNAIGPQPMSGITVANNIAFNNAGVQISNVNNNASLITNQITDPLFIGPGNYHLQPSSSAIDAGTAQTAFNTDKDGLSRPQGAGWDIGAYEQ